MWLKEDGSLNLPALDQLAENLKAVTDHLTSLDKILRAARLGVEMQLVFQCGESGLFYPADYVKNWGKLYGIGLGPSPVSESLQSEYDVEPAEMKGLRSITQVMHPVRVSGAQMDMREVSVELLAPARPILVMDDPHMEARAQVLREKQLRNPAGKIRLMEAAWERSGRRVA